MSITSIYVDNCEFVDIVSNSSNDYKVIVNNNLKNIFNLNKYIDEIKINNNTKKI